MINVNKLMITVPCVVEYDSKDRVLRVKPHGKEELFPIMDIAGLSEHEIQLVVQERFNKVNEASKKDAQQISLTSKAKKK